MGTELGLSVYVNLLKLAIYSFLVVSFGWR